MVPATGSIHRERSRNHRVLRARQDDHVRRGVHFHQLPCVRRRQRQQLAPRASTWRCKGAKQTALAPREGQALEERSSSSRSSTSWPRTRGQQLPCVRRRQRQQLAPRASTWRCKGAKQTALAPREGQALEERSSSSRSSTSWPRTRGRQLPCVRRRQRQQLAPRASKWRLGGAKQKQPEGWRKEGLIALGEDLAQRTAALARDVHLSCVITTTTAAARAPTSGARSKRVRWPRARSSPKPRAPSRGRRAAQHARQSRSPFVITTTTANVDVEDDDGSSRSRSAAELALEGRGCTAVPHHREQGAATAARARGCQPRRPARSPCVIMTTAAVRASQ